MGIFNEATSKHGRIVRSQAKKGKLGQWLASPEGRGKRAQQKYRLKRSGERLAKRGYKIGPLGDDVEAARERYLEALSRVNPLLAESLQEAGVEKYRRRAFRAKGAVPGAKAKLHHAVMGNYGTDARETGYIGTRKTPESHKERQARRAAHRARRGVKTKGR